MQTVRTFLVAAVMLGVSAAQALSPPPPLPVEFLADFYEAMDGDNWHRNDGWLDPDVPVCEWYGITCVTELPQLGGFNWIGYIRLAGNNLRGELDASLVAQMNCDCPAGVPSRELDLSGNAISGEFPTVLPIVPRRVILADNQLSGPLPTLPGFNQPPGTSPPPPPMRLEHLDLSGNDFSGSIPTSWQSLDLDLLDLSNNQLEGSIELALNALASEGAILRLADNPLSGTIEAEWLAERDLEEINLCWTGVAIDDPDVQAWLEDKHEGGSPELCMGRERIALDPSISGSWYDPARDGEGFSLMLLENGTPLVYWFSHISLNRQLWLFNTGRAVDSSSRFRPLLRTRGEFGLGFADHPWALTRGGELRLDRVESDRLHAEFRIAYTGYDLVQPGQVSITWPPMPDISLRWDHIRLSQLAGSTCENALAQQWISGVWFDPERDGEGFVVEVNEDGRGIVYWFSYMPTDTNLPDRLPQAGDWQAWMMGAGSFEGERLIIDPILRPRDTGFAAPGDTDHISAEPWGTLTLHFHDDDQGLAEFDSLDEEFGSASFLIQRLARPLLAECEISTE